MSDAKNIEKKLNGHAGLVFKNKHTTHTDNSQNAHY